MKVTFTINLSEEEIKPDDYFFFYQHDGMPTIRKAKDNENWNGWTNAKTGEKSYYKIESISDLLISPRALHPTLPTVPNKRDNGEH